jgi:uncharacterized membrane protein
MRLFGHPVHPLLIHFPTALLPMDLALSVIFWLRGDAEVYEAGAYCLWAGSALGWLALLTGLVDLTAIPRTNKKGLALALIHGSLNGIILLTYGVIAYKSWQAFPSPYFSGSAAVAVKSVLVICLFIGNFLGGRLIYTYYIGIRFKKAADGNTAA